MIKTTFNPSLFSPLATPAQIAEWDAISAQEHGIPTFLLMENAARAAFYYLKEEYKISAKSKILIIAGGGNNGGDGISLARHLHNAGCKVVLLCSPSLKDYKNICRKHLSMAKKSGVWAEKLRLKNSGIVFSKKALEVFAAAEQSLGQNFKPDIIVDALLGAGFTGSLRASSLEIIKAINTFKDSFIYALDLPSGLNPLSGLPAPEAVRANLTVSFAALKPGLCLPWAKEFTGKVKNAEIGLAKDLIAQENYTYLLLSPKKNALPPLEQEAHKGSAGQVLIIGGSKGLTGAPQLSALAALRMGSGLVTVAAPAKLCSEIKGPHAEIMTLPLGETDEWDISFIETISEFISNMSANSALILGPGLGRDQKLTTLIKNILTLQARPPLLLDADALFRLKLQDRLTDTDFISTELLQATDVLTPHPRELQRILSPHDSLDYTVQKHVQDQELRVQALKLICAHCKAAVILKGAGSLIAQENSPVHISPFAEANLAVGGSGDILAGIVASLLARKFTALEGSALGVFIHAQSGRLLKQKYPSGGNLASEIATLIPQVLTECFNE